MPSPVLPCRLPLLPVLAVALSAALLLPAAPAAADTPEAERPRWAATLYGGPIATNDTSDILLEGTLRYRGPWVVMGALRRDVFDLSDSVSVVLEGQAGQHFNSSNHQELNALYGLTWRWDGGSLTGLHGLSYATKVPRFVQEEDDPNGNPSQWMSYLGGELAFDLPGRERTAAVFRYHHRSSMFGTFPGVQDEMNLFALGLQMRF